MSNYRSILCFVSYLYWLPNFPHMAWVNPWNMVFRHFPKVPHAGFETQSLRVENFYLSFYFYFLFSFSTFFHLFSFFFLFFYQATNALTSQFKNKNFHEDRLRIYQWMHYESNQSFLPIRIAIRFAWTEIRKVFPFTRFRITLVTGIMINDFFII